MTKHLATRKSVTVTPAFYQADSDSPRPRLLVLVSGKRKSGKDHVTSRLLEAAAGRGLPAAWLRVSKPLKVEYARLHSLDPDRLADSSPYKETHRTAMIAWGEQLRAKDPGCFCRLAVAMANPPADGLWVVSDVRRPSDIQFFQSAYPNLVHLLRLSATEEARSKRGWVFTPGIDDAESECALDSWELWHSHLDNSGDSDEVDRWIEHILNKVTL